MLSALLLVSTLYAFGDKVIHFIKEPGKIALSLQKGYGVQRDGKHELTFTSVATGKVLKKVNVLKGSVAPEDKKYFSRLEPILVPVTGERVRVTGRIFYCSFGQKFCSVQRVDEEL